jgi:hypothetical protein
VTAPHRSILDRTARAFASGIGAATLAASLLVATPVHAQTGTLTDSEKELVGTAWEFSNSDRDKTCTITFSADRAGSGHKLSLEDKCTEFFAPAKDVTSWSYPDNDLLRLFDGKGKALIEFSEVESGIFEAPTPGFGVLFLQIPGADVAPPPKPPEQVAGDWTVMRGGTALCQLSLAVTPAGEGMSLTIKPGCDPAVARQLFASWQLDRDELVLTPARGNAWRFESIDDKTWQRVPESPNPYTLVRQ